MLEWGCFGIKACGWGSLALQSYAQRLKMPNSFPPLSLTEAVLLRYSLQSQTHCYIQDSEDEKVDSCFSNGRNSEQGSKFRVS